MRVLRSFRNSLFTSVSILLVVELAFEADSASVIDLGALVSILLVVELAFEDSTTITFLEGVRVSILLVVELAFEVSRRDNHCLDFFPFQSFL